MSNIMPTILPFLIIFSVLLPPTATSFNNQTDLLSLLAIKSSLEDPLEALHSWNQTIHYCTWKGIQCIHDRVVAVNLASQGLVGSLSPHIGNLSLLIDIVLQNNTFLGHIPQELGRLTKLLVVNFSNNSFTGTIPRNLSNCPNLVLLNLIDNELSGSIPAELGSMSKLRELGLGFNKLSGPIPPFIGNLTALSLLSLLACGLTGEIPDSYAQLQSLEFLQLSENGLTGTIPSGLFNISSVWFFSVADNQLHGVLPPDVGGNTPNLEYLFLWLNRFSGPIPVSISNASFLQSIELDNNYFTGRMPRVGKLPRLRGFVFDNNLIEDDLNFISSLTNCTNLKLLQVGDNLLTGSFPYSVANLSSQLMRLNLYGNRIHGNIPSGIGKLINLAKISLYGNFLNGSIPLSIGKLLKLRDLDLKNNRFSGELRVSFGNLTFLSRLFLDENNFSGNVPSGLGNCTNLLELDLSHNNFHGFIPREIMKLSPISVVLNLSHNALEGSIPYEVGSLTNLAAMDLSNNRLSGTIPDSASKCVSLEKLYLDGNLVQGEIPLALSALVGLQELDLSRNNLSGRIPSSLGKLNLSRLNLSFNRLLGEVPVVGVFKNITSISLDGNEGLCGGIPELKLSPCFKSPKKNLSSLQKVLISVSVSGGICIVLLMIFSYKKRKSRRNQTSSMPSLIGIQFMRLSYADLLQATGGFSRGNLVGVGRFGSVYKGILSDEQTLVAVKVLNLVTRGASKSFLAECNALRSARHRNLVKILSVCDSIDFQGNDFKALVYEFKANGSLEKWLHHERGQEEEIGEEIRNLSMIQRLNIVIDIAQAIEYLHVGNDSAIIHGDLKPSNILLDLNMSACVGDFGLAKIVSDIVPSHESNSSAGIRGTIGYVPPEYGTSHLVSVQGDVYSYGIVLLEMFTNKRPIDDFSADHVNLHNFVSPALPDGVMEIIDPRLRTGRHMNDDKMTECVAAILSIGVSCSNDMPRDRMSMKDVVIEWHQIHRLLSI